MGTLHLSPRNRDCRSTVSGIRGSLPADSEREWQSSVVSPEFPTPYTSPRQWMTCLLGNRCAPVITASPGRMGAKGRHSSASPGHFGVAFGQVR